MKIENIETFSILAGNEICNARCPYCVSKMTPLQGINDKEPIVNWRNIQKACLLSKMSGVNTVMITGKGEPTLFPNQLTQFLEILQKFEFPIIELQTNGIILFEKADIYNPSLKKWYDLGLTTIAISIVHYDPLKNKEIYSPHKSQYIDLQKLITTLHKQKFSVRLATILIDGFIDTSKKLQELIEFAKTNNVEQLTVRPVNRPKESQNLQISDWVKQHHLKEHQLEEMQSFLNTHGIPLMSLSHNAKVYDVDGQNICFTNSLTINAKTSSIRQLIFFPDGHLRFDWQYKGAILL
ncbi:MAG: radical SAM protein [Candidatus Daviesbacteria bacterium]